MTELTLWEDTVGALESDAKGGNLDLWLRQAKLLRVDDGVAHIEVLNGFCRDWIRERHLPRILEVLSRRLGVPVDVEFHLAQTSEPARPQTSSSEPRRPVTQTSRDGMGPNPRYTFDRFVEGPSNQLAVEVAKAIAARPEEAAHPLYVYAASGLGKTHLLSAIANAVLARDPRKRVGYLETQRFVEEFVRAVRSSSIEAFDRRYREECDLLLLDDVHVLGGKDGTQERFFHIFNALHDRRVPIVMTSDQQPKELRGIEERLRTRFVWGLIVDIQPPEFETRVAILRKKADEDGIALPDDVAQIVAHHVTGSVRELEGTLGRLAAQAHIARTEIDPALAREVLGALSPAPQVTCTTEDVQKAVCSAFSIHLSELRGPSRRRALTLPRHIAMYLSREALRQSFPAIAEQFGNRDHTTVMAACRRVKTLLEADRAIQNVVGNLRRQLSLS